MKLELKSFAKIRSAEIKCDGITVIAGENNTGKSTIGKTLFSLFNSTHNLSGKIENERKKQIVKFLRRHLVNLFSEVEIDNRMSRVNINRAIDRIVDEIITEAFFNDEEMKVDQLSDLIDNVIKKYYNINNDDKLQEKLLDLTNKVLEIVSLPDKKIESEYISRYFQNIFYQQINSVIEDETEALIQLTIKNKVMKVAFIDNKCNKFDTEYSILNNAFYIDNPFVLDELNGVGSFLYYDNVLKTHIISKLKIDKNDMMDGLIESVRAQEKLSEIYNVLGNIVNGEVIRNSNGEYYYNLDKFKEQINVNNLSTGLKSFVLIKMLLEKAALKEKDVLILDEPEIHLHPQWQIYYAELIVLLQKQFDLTIIITTHSPYFIDAIEVFSAKYRLSDKVNYYLSDILDDYTVCVKDVTDNIELIYKKLADPMQYLENLRNTVMRDEK